MNNQVLVTFSGQKEVGKKVARKLKIDFSEIKLERLPDGESRLRFGKEIEGKEVVLLQSFYPDINDKIVETLLAGYTADRYARKVTLVALYFPYLREDKEFEKHEAVSAKIMADLFDVFDKVYICEPHLHRFKKLNEFFPNASKISLTDAISKFVSKLSKPLIIGPDEESEQWAEYVARVLGVRYDTLKKKRLGPRKVKTISTLNLKDIDEKSFVIIDDMISTGGTMIEVVKYLKKFKKKMYVIAFHGLFVEKALEKLKKLGVDVITTNTIKNKVSKIDVSDSIAEVLK